MTTSTSVERRRLRARLALLSFSTILCSGLAAPAFGQAAQLRRNLDANSVDLTFGDFVMAFEEGSIGSSQAKLSLVRQNVTNGPSQWDGYTFHRSGSGGSLGIDIGLPGGRRDRFTGSLGGNSVLGNGAKLTQNSGGNYTYRMADGSTVTFADPTGGDAQIPGSGFCGAYGSSGTSDCILLPLAMDSPNGQPYAGLRPIHDLGRFGKPKLLHPDHKGH